VGTSAPEKEYDMSACKRKSDLDPASTGIAIEIDRIRKLEVALFEKNQNSALAIRLTGLRMELLRLAGGLPIRLTSLLRGSDGD
jgi:hypothetical protein